MNSDDSNSSSAFETSAGDDETVTSAVVRAVASVSGSSPIDLPPLFDAIDPDALDALFRGRGGDCRIEFTYDDYTIVVHADETIEVHEDRATT